MSLLGRRARYRGIVEKNIIPKLGHVPVRKLTAVHIEAFEAELQREGWVKARAKQKVKEGEEAPIQEKRGLSAQTALHIHRDAFASAQPRRAAWRSVQEPSPASKAATSTITRDQDTRQE